MVHTQVIASSTLAHAIMIEMIDKLLKTAYNEVGYLEKATNDCLDDKTANAGYGNFTKYARDLFSYLQGYSWCCMFVYWCFDKAFGMSTKYIIGEKTAKCATLKYLMQNIYCKVIDKRDVEKGDIVFFKNSDNEICHIGIVYSTGKEYFSTIEGNTVRGTDNVVANGGGVFIRAYKYDNDRIDSFVRPQYPVESCQECQKVDENAKKFTFGVIKLQNPKSYLNIRKQPTTDSQVIGTLNHNDKVKSVGETKGWYQIEYEDICGYCSKAYIHIIE